MPNHSVKVQQLRSQYGDAFLNVQDTQIPGAIAVWGSCYQMPVYLLQDGIQFCLVVFTDEAWAEEQLPNLQKHYSKVTKLEPLED